MRPWLLDSHHLTTVTAYPRSDLLTRCIVTTMTIRAGDQDSHDAAGPYHPEELADRTIDLAVIPTMARESYSFILDEAAALGCPILSADAGALRGRATARVRLFRRGDVEDLTVKLQDLVDHPGAGGMRSHLEKDAYAVRIGLIDGFGEIEPFEGLF